MKNQSVLLAKETEDGYISLGTITLMPDRSNDADKTEKKSDAQGNCKRKERHDLNRLECQVECQVYVKIMRKWRFAQKLSADAR